MSRSSRFLVAVLAAVLFAPCLAYGQSQGGGYWDRGRWIGYMPAHLEQSAPAARSTTDSTATDVADVDPSEKAPRPVPPQVEPADPAPEFSESAESEQVVQAQYTQRVSGRSPAYARPSDPAYSQPRGPMPAGAYRPTGDRMNVARRPMFRGVAPASHEMVEPIPMGESMVEGETMPMAGSSAPCTDCQGPDCGPGECAPCEEYECGFFSVCRPRWLWGRAEYLGWWTSGMRLPALVTTNPDAAPTLADPDTVILFGGEEVNRDARSGGRFTLGVWLDPCATRGLEATYFGLGSQSTSFYADSDGFDRLGRPFFNIEEGEADVHLISDPNPLRTGFVSASAETKFQGIEVLFRRGVKRCPNSHVDLLVGWRWMQLKDDLFIRESVDQGPLELFDQFDASNNFHGVEFGVEAERPLTCCWTLATVGKLAIGNTYSSVRIDGAQTGEPDQGLLALDSNSGTHKRESFASVVELGVSVKRRFACGLEATFGYSLVYWSDVLRAGDQVDLDLDPRQVPPEPVAATHPQFPGCQTDFWAQGLHFGLEYGY